MKEWYQELNAIPTDNLVEWLIETAAKKGLGDSWTLLAHTDDGVVWGRFDGTQLWESGDVFGTVKVDWNGRSVQQLRLFNSEAELLVWQSNGGLMGRIVNKVADEQAPKIMEESQLLWGIGTVSQDSFTLMVEGQQGLHHALPLANGDGRAANLNLRHYVAYDEMGQAYIALSRLIALDWA